MVTLVCQDHLVLLETLDQVDPQGVQDQGVSLAHQVPLVSQDPLGLQDSLDLKVREETKDLEALMGSPA